VAQVDRYAQDPKFRSAEQIHPCAVASGIDIASGHATIRSPGGGRVCAVLPRTSCPDTDNAHAPTTLLGTSEGRLHQVDGDPLGDGSRGSRTPT
jgi:hypothetical protein